MIRNFFLSLKWKKIKLEKSCLTKIEKENRVGAVFLDSLFRNILTVLRL